MPAESQGRNLSGQHAGSVLKRTERKKRPKDLTAMAGCSFPKKSACSASPLCQKIHLIRGRKAASLRVKSESSNMCGDSEALRVCPAVLKVQGKRALVEKATAGGLFRHAARGCFLLETSPGDLKAVAAGKACQSALPWPEGIPPSERKVSVTTAPFSLRMDICMVPLL